MAWYLTRQQLNYGKQHVVRLTGYAGQPMANSKISVSGGGNPTSIGIQAMSYATTNFNQQWSGLYGAFMGDYGSHTTVTAYYRFWTLKHFIPTRMRWYWTRNGNGWATLGHAVFSFNNGAITTLWHAGVSAGQVYDYSFPDNVILGWNLLSSNDGPGINMEARNNNGNFRGILEVWGFQTPYPNLAQFKNDEGQLGALCQTIAYKDSNGVVHTAGRLV